MKKYLSAIAVIICLSTYISNAQMFMRERPVESISPDGPGSVQRSDGSVLKITEDGAILVSTDGKNPYVTVPGKKAFDEKEGATELWRDNVQYHLLVKAGDKALYYRSGNGVDWVFDSERPAGTGRKDLQPNIQMRIMSGSAETANTESVLVMISSSAGFNPVEDLDQESLRFGSPAVVNAGNGSRSVYDRVMGNNLILGFPEEGAGLTSDDFAIKIAGLKKDGTQVFAFAKMTGYNGENEIFAVEGPSNISSAGADVKVTNFGVKSSHSAIVTASAEYRELATASIDPLLPGESRTVRMDGDFTSHPSKKTRKTILLTSDAVDVTVARERFDWEDPHVIGINKEPYHATLDLPTKIADRSDVMSLDGKWKFLWSKDPQSRPEDFYKLEYDCSGWDDIIVPCAWQLQGFGKAIYTNITSPYKISTDGSVTEEPDDKQWYHYDHRDPVGSYVTTIKLDKKEAGKNYFLEFGGVKSAFYVWINGEKVG